MPPKSPPRTYARIAQLTRACSWYISKATKTPRHTNMPVPVALARGSPTVPQLRPPIALPSPNNTWEQQPDVSIVYSDTQHTPLGGSRSIPSLAWGLGGLGTGYVATRRGSVTGSVAEALALRNGLIDAKRRGFKKVEVVGNSKLVIDVINGVSAPRGDCSSFVKILNPFEARLSSSVSNMF
ncbi:hypothetical protein ACLB2K_006556 [Fragaria x ananassa]